MAKLYYKFGVMNSSKSANLLMTKHNYESTGKKVALIQSDKNSRNGNRVVSRIGLESYAMQISDTDNIFNIFKNTLTLYDAILVDEVQFLTVSQIEELALIADILHTDVLCYGLKTNYLGNLFPAIAKLLVLADNISEIKQVCSHCNSKAIMNLKVQDGKAIYEGDTISIGDIQITESLFYYEPVCRFHYFNPIIEPLCVSSVKGNGE